MYPGCSQLRGCPGPDWMAKRDYLHRRRGPGRGRWQELRRLRRGVRGRPALLLGVRDAAGAAAGGDIRAPRRAASLRPRRAGARGRHGRDCAKAGRGCRFHAFAASRRSGGDGDARLRRLPRLGHQPDRAERRPAVDPAGSGVLATAGRRTGGNGGGSGGGGRSGAAVAGHDLQRSARAGAGGRTGSRSSRRTHGSARSPGRRNPAARQARVPDRAGRKRLRRNVRRRLPGALPGKDAA